MVCPSCGIENPAPNTFCGKCGTALGAAPGDAATSVPRYGDQKRLIKRELAMIGGGVAALVCAGWVAWYLLVATRSPAHVVKAFIEADKAGQYAREQELIANSWDNRMALSLFQSLRKQSRTSPFQNYRIVSTGEFGGSRTSYVEVEVTMPTLSIPYLSPAPAMGSGGPPHSKLGVMFILTRQSDEWKIDASQTLATVASALAAQGLQSLPLGPGSLPSFPSLPNIQLPPGWPNITLPPAATAPPSSGGSGPPSGGAPAPSGGAPAPSGGVGSAI
jgi:hypothetical protein